MAAIKAVNAAVRFLLELCALGALGYWGFRTGSAMAVKIALGIGMPVLAAVLWMIFGAPGAPRQLLGPWHLALEVLILGGAAVALYAAGQQVLAVAFAAVIVVNEILLYALGQAQIPREGGADGGQPRRAGGRLGSDRYQR
jgi:hypothetical protein